MKNRIIFFVFTFLLFACTSKIKNELTESEKEEIKTEILKIWDYSSKGITELNAEKAFSVFSTKENTKYLREGHLYESINAAEKQYASFFANNPGKVRLTFDPLIFDILTKEIVIVTAIGKYVFTDFTDSESTTIIGYSIVWQKEEDNWKILNMHTSLQ